MKTNAALLHCAALNKALMQQAHDYIFNMSAASSSDAIKVPLEPGLQLAHHSSQGLPSP